MALRSHGARASLARAPRATRELLARLAAAALILLLAARSPDVVWAHPEVLSTEPADGARVDQSPPQARVVFNEEVEQAFAQLQVLDAQGAQVDAGDGARDPANPASVVAALPPLPAGIYTAVWQVTGSDGHTVRGHYVFTVVIGAAPAILPEAPPAPPAAPAAAAPLAVAEREPPIALVAALRALMLLGAMSSVGGWVLVLAVIYPALPATAQAAGVAARRRWRIVTGASLALLLAALAGFLLAHTATTAGELSLPALATVLGATRQGQLLAARAALVGLLAVLLTAARPPRWELPVALLLGGGLLLTFASAGHAAALADEPGLLFSPVLADWTHLAATSVWVGGLVHLTLTLPAALRALAPPDRARSLARVVGRFSALALASVALLALSGAYMALLRLTSPAQLLESAYGQALLSKLALFGALLALGAYNLLRLRPRLEAVARRAFDAALAARLDGRLRLAVRAEVLLACGALLAAGFITSAAPPTESAQTAPAVVDVTPIPGLASAPTRTPAPIVPFRQEQRAADLRVTLAVAPAGIGQNDLRVEVADADGRPLDVQRVQLTLDMDAMDMGETVVVLDQAGGGVYQVRQQWLSMVGEWRVRTVVRRADADDVVVEFVVPVGG